MKMSFKGADICLILGNLLENAVEAAEKVRENKYIKIKMKYDKSNLLIFLINSYQGQLIKMKDKSLKSRNQMSGIMVLDYHRYIEQLLNITERSQLMILYRNSLALGWYYMDQRNNYINRWDYYIINNAEKKR